MMRLSAVCVFALACSANTIGPGMEERECLDDRDCPATLICEDFQCLPPLPGERMECDTDADCPTDYTCEDRGSLRICIPPDIGPEDCGFCPAPGMCRDGVCIQPDEEGAFCEFDSDCGDPNLLCIGGRCTWDPRVPRTCTDGEECPDGLMCAMDGRCVCTGDADCPVGTICSDTGECVPGGDCIGDDECPMGMLCDRGMCIPEAACDVVHPDLSTPPVWNVNSIYNFREALPGWLAGFLDVVAGPFRFLAGDSDDPDLGLPGFIEDLIGDAIRNWAEDNLPPYVLEAMGGIADFNDIMSTWLVEETMELTPTADRDGYRGQNEWTQVAFMYRGDMVVGDPAMIAGWSYTPADYDAQAVCGTLNIERHDVEVGIGAIIAWALNAIVYESTDGRYRNVDAMLAGLSGAFCNQARSLAEGIYSGAGSLAYAWCTDIIAGYADDLVDAINGALLELDLVKLKGHAVIIDGENLEPGVWEGTMLGGDFSGTWSADRSL